MRGTEQEEVASALPTVVVLVQGLPLLLLEAPHRICKDRLEPLTMLTVEVVVGDVKYTGDRGVPTKRSGT